MRRMTGGSVKAQVGKKSEARCLKKTRSELTCREQ